METLTPKILENLFNFLDIGEGDTSTRLTQKIHQTRLEIAGQKSTKQKKEQARKLAEGQ